MAQQVTVTGRGGSFYNLGERVGPGIGLVSVNDTNCDPSGVVLIFSYRTPIGMVGADRKAIFTSRFFSGTTEGHKGRMMSIFGGTLVDDEVFVQQVFTALATFDQFVCPFADFSPTRTAPMSESASERILTTPEAEGLEYSPRSHTYSYRFVEP